MGATSKQFWPDNVNVRDHLEAHDGIKFIPNFVKIGELIPTLLGETNMNGWAGGKARGYDGSTAISFLIKRVKNQVFIKSK
jgi:hypothetical protein